MTVRKSIARTALAALGLMLWLADLALAAGGEPGQGEQVGRNLGEMLGGWAKSLYVGIVGLVALVFLLNRRFADLALFVLASIVVGGFVLAPGDISSTVREIWHTVTG